MLNSDLLYQQALKYVGISEIDGIDTNPIIDDWIKWAMPWVRNEKDLDSRYAWCAIFLSRMLYEINLLPFNEPIIAARKFITVGYEVENPKQGDIIILERGPGKGHIGILDKILPNGKYRLLGGNQQNKVGFNDFDPKRIISKRTVNTNSQV